MRTSFVLTVAQSKRLIAKGVAQMPEVKHALADGILAIGRGTTNAYVVEEILGKTITKQDYVLGRTLPPGVPGGWLGGSSDADVVLKRGQLVEDGEVAAAVQGMGAGDVFIKGGNALDYQRKVVGVLIGHPTGGTAGATYGTIVSRKINLILPIGLEKLVCEDIVSLSVDSRHPDSHPNAPCVPLFPLVGTVVTELEALALLCGVKARLLSSGGVAGAEGAVWLMVEGDRESLDRALALHGSLASEPNMGLTRKPDD